MRGASSTVGFLVEVPRVVVAVVLQVLGLVDGGEGASSGRVTCELPSPHEVLPSSLGGHGQERIEQPSPTRWIRRYSGGARRQPVRGFSMSWVQKAVGRGVLPGALVYSESQRVIRDVVVRNVATPDRAGVGAGGGRLRGVVGCITQVVVLDVDVGIVGVGVGVLGASCSSRCLLVEGASSWMRNELPRVERLGLTATCRRTVAMAGAQDHRAQSHRQLRPGGEGERPSGPATREKKKRQK